MMRLAPEPLILAAYRARYDFHNPKQLLKAALAVEAEEGAFQDWAIDEALLERY